MAWQYFTPGEGNRPLNSDDELRTLKKLAIAADQIADAVTPPSGSDFLQVNTTTGAIESPVTAETFRNGNAISTNLRGNLLFVDAVNGNDATGARGTTRAFLTWSAARAVAVSGDTTVFFPGTHAEAMVAKDGVDMLFMPNAIVSPATGSALSVPTGISCSIRGNGSFISTEDAAHAVSLTGTGTVHLEAFLIQSQGASAAGLYGTKDNYYVTAADIISDQYDGVWSESGAGVVVVNTVTGADQGLENQGTLDITAQTITGGALAVTSAGGDLTIRNATILGGEIVYNDNVGVPIAGNVLLESVTMDSGSNTVIFGFDATFVIKNSRFSGAFAIDPASTSTLEVSATFVDEINDTGWWTGDYINGSGVFITSNIIAVNKATTSNLDRASTITPAADTDLQLTLGPGTWQIMGEVRISETVVSNAVGSRLQLNATGVTASGSSQFIMAYPGSSPNAFTSNSTPATGSAFTLPTAVQGSASARYTYRINALLVVATSAVVDVEWAQFVSSTDPSRRFAGSYMTAKKL